MKKTEFATCLAVLEAAVAREFRKEQAEVWYDLLGDLPVESIKAAVKRALLESEYPGIPPVGRIRRLAAEHCNGVPIDAEQAFARVREAVSRFGYPEPAKARKFIGAAAWSVVEGIGGWSRVCDSPPDQRQNLFAQFRDGWQRAASRQQQQHLLPEDLRPHQRIEGAREHPEVRMLAESLREVG